MKQKFSASVSPFIPKKKYGRISFSLEIGYDLWDGRNYNRFNKCFQVAAHIKILFWWIDLYSYTYFDEMAPECSEL